MRDTIVIACLVLGIVLAAACAALAVGPALGRRIAFAASDPPSRRRALLALALPAAAAFAAAAALLAPAHYTVSLSPGGAVVAAPGGHVTATIENAGLIGGRWGQDVTLDGRQAGRVTAEVSGRGSATAIVPLPDDLSPGAHRLDLGGERLRFTALTPPRFGMGALSVYPDVVAVGGDVRVTLTVTNTGQARGVFAGVLRVDGRRVKAKPLELAGGESGSVSLKLRAGRPGVYRLDLCGARGRLLVVRTVRPRTGTALARSDGGLGRLLFQNRTPDDCMVVLTSAARPSARPTLVVYIRARDEWTLTGIGDGKRYIYYVRGRGWNHTTDDFLSETERSRFKRAAAFTTSSWTTSSTDWRQWTVVTTKHTRYTQWRVTVKPGWVWGPRGGAVAVAADDFPRF